jgi:RNA polymerase sigma factor (sigma-70 family)
MESSQLGIARKVVAEYTDQISQANIPLVLKLARRFILPGVELDDLIGDGVHKLLQCIDLFDVSRGLRFSTYLYRALIFLYLRGRSTENATWRKRVDDPEETVLGDIRADEEDADESDMLLELRTVLATNAARLTKLEKQIVLLSLEKTQAEVSIITGCTKAKQKEHRDNAIEKLRKTMIAGYESPTT